MSLPKTVGAWLIHHTDKLGGVTKPHSFDAIEAAGRCGILLSALSANEQSTLATNQVHAIATAAGINTHVELPGLLSQLQARELVEVGDAGVTVLGVTLASVLEHTAAVFEHLSPDPRERAAIELAELASAAPVQGTVAREYVGDTFKLTTNDAEELLTTAESVGFTDAEDLGDGQKLFFNGHLFRRDTARKAYAVLMSLSEAEQRNLREVEQLLEKQGCVTVDEVKKILGDQLFEKAHAVGLFDVSEVSNDRERVFFVTRPAAFGKFDSLIEDAMDLAKAFVASITYGMTRSSSSRGRISMVQALMSRLIEGKWVGPATAIGQDYKALEVKRVVEVRHQFGNRYSMRLLKREVGELALKVIIEGDASDASLPNFPGSPVTQYSGPESQRVITRRKQAPHSKRAVARMIEALRTGRGS